MRTRWWSLSTSGAIAYRQRIYGTVLFRSLKLDNWSARCRRWRGLVPVQPLWEPGWWCESVHGRSSDAHKEFPILQVWGDLCKCVVRHFHSQGVKPRQQHSVVDGVERSWNVKTDESDDWSGVSVTEYIIDDLHVLSGVIHGWALAEFQQWFQLWPQSM